MTNIVVVGAGVMGSNHARVAAGLPGMELVAVVDLDLERAKAVAGPLGARAFATVEEVFATVGADEQPRAAVVATPTAFHASTATALIDRGVAVLVEKPIAATVEEAEQLVAHAAARGVTLMVGHIERFNSAVAELLRLDQIPLHVSIERIGPFTARVADSVIHDLMIHDLDIVRSLGKSPVARVQAVGQRTRSQQEDIAVAMLTFESGMTATITASRLGQQKIRQISLTMPDSFIVADLIRQDLSVTRVEHVEYVSATGTRYRQTAAVEIPFLENRGEPLGAELREFIRAVESGTTPLVTGADGVEAIKLVHLVTEAVRAL